MNATKMVVVLSESVSVLAMAYGRYGIALLCAPLIVAHLLSTRKGGDGGRRDALLLSKRILEGMRNGKRVNALAIDREKTGIGSEIAGMARRHVLGDGAVLPSACRTGLEGEFVGAIALRLRRGADIRKALSLISAGLEREINVRNKLNAVTSGMSVLTRAGLVLFLPLFGGVSSGILGASLGPLGGFASALQQKFLLVISTYVIVMLYACAAMEKPSAGVWENAWKVAPLSALSLFVLLLTSHYAANML